MIRRALRLRCPLCGARGIWRAFGQLVDRCPGCGYAFEREEGYWTGGLIINYAIAVTALAAILAAGWARYGAALPTWVTVLAAATMIVLPTVGYPWSKTLWMIVDFKINPYTEEERPQIHDGHGSDR